MLHTREPDCGGEHLSPFRAELALEVPHQSMCYIIFCVGGVAMSRNLVRTLGLGVLLLVLSSAPAFAHFLGYSAVDAMEIRWGGSTQYSTARDYAHTTWNALGKVNIAPDTATTYEDLTYSDIDRTDLIFTGRYTYYSVGSDTLQFNIAYMGADDYAKNTALHELGHALGLAHSSSGNVMYSSNTSQTDLGDHDMADYATLYP